MFLFSFKMLMYICRQQSLLTFFPFTYLIWASNISNFHDFFIDHLNSGRVCGIYESCVLNHRLCYSHTEAIQKTHPIPLLVTLQVWLTKFGALNCKSKCKELEIRNLANQKFTFKAQKPLRFSYIVLQIEFLEEVHFLFLKNCSVLLFILKLF
jgi:hypothetical protein